MSSSGVTLYPSLVTKYMDEVELIEGMKAFDLFTIKIILDPYTWFIFALYCSRIMFKISIFQTLSVVEDSFKGLSRSPIG